MADDPDQSPVDPFALDGVFGEPQALLDHVCQNIDSVKGDTIVCLDANVLLLPYQFSGMSLDAMIGVYRQLSSEGRLKIPARAAREYLKHRTEKITEIDKSLADHISKNRPTLNDINFMEGNKDLKEIREFEKEIKLSEKKIAARISKIRDNLNGGTGSDPISEAYRSVLKESVIELNGFNKDEFMKDLKFRYENKIPPGFKDVAKEDGGVGDLLIWKTILQIGADEHKDLIFVTADSKGDWWTRRGDSERPRLELVEEYRAASGGRSFYLLKLSDALKLFGVGSAEVETVRIAEDEFSQSLQNKNAFLWHYYKDKRSEIDNLKAERTRLINKASKYKDQSTEYVPSFIMRELSDIEDRLERLMQSDSDIRNNLNRNIHSPHSHGDDRSVESAKIEVSEPCPNCGGELWTLSRVGKRHCVRCSYSGS